MTRDRVDRAISAMSEAQKSELLDEHIGPVRAGSAPDPVSDSRYLRDIVRIKLREQDEKGAGAIAALEQRVAKLERFIEKTVIPGTAVAIVDTVQRLIDAGGYMRHRGTWDPAHAYQKGDCVVDGGGTWLAVADVADDVKPGKALEWRLIARGDAGKGTAP